MGSSQLPGLPRSDLGPTENVRLAWRAGAVHRFFRPPNESHAPVVVVVFLGICFFFLPWKLHVCFVFFWGVFGLFWVSFISLMAGHVKPGSP